MTGNSFGEWTAPLHILWKMINVGCSYYERHGFTPIGDFVIEEENWPGTALEMKL